MTPLVPIAEQCAFALFLHQEKRYLLRQVAVRGNMSKTSVWRIVYSQDKKIESEKTFTKRDGAKR